MEQQIKKPIVDVAALLEEFGLTEYEDSIPMPEPLASLPKHLKVYLKHDVPPTKKELARPARCQVSPDTIQKTAYFQGSEDYNIWYGKYASDRMSDTRRERPPAPGHCNPLLDSGWTLADMFSADCPICIYYAKGCCAMGAKCKYLHRVPTKADDDALDMMHDVFGRERHAQHRDDLEGVGSFNSPSRTLYVGEMKVDRADPNNVAKTEAAILKHFCLWGPVESIKFIPNRNFAFVTYQYRVAAEFAKVAMANYKLEYDDEIILVKWAQNDKSSSSREEEDIRSRREARRMFIKRMASLGYVQPAGSGSSSGLVSGSRPY